MPSEPPRGFRIVVALTSAGSPSNPRVRADPVIDPPQADVELDVLFAPYGLAHNALSSTRASTSTRQLSLWMRQSIDVGDRPAAGVLGVAVLCGVEKAVRASKAIRVGRHPAGIEQLIERFR